MKGWSITCKFIGEGKSIIAVIKQEEYEFYTETTNTFEACFQDVGLFLDEKYTAKYIVTSIEQDITHILLDFLKKTSSFGNIVKTDLSYAAFTFLRANDWTYDAPNYRYRFLGAHKDQNSDHKLWTGNKYFCHGDYHAGSNVHKYLRGIPNNHNHDSLNMLHINTGLLLSSRHDTHERANVGRFMIDIPEKVELLMGRLKNALPVPTTIPALLANQLSERSSGFDIPRRCDIIDVFYTGDAGGILCCLDIGSKDPHLVSITLLSFNRHHHLAREIEAYQRHRIKKLKQQPTFH